MTTVLFYFPRRGDGCGALPIDSPCETGTARKRNVADGQEDKSKMRVNPLVVLLVACNIFVWGGVYAFEALANNEVLVVGAIPGAGRLAGHR